jgi:hypothetical protein
MRLTGRPLQRSIGHWGETMTEVSNDFLQTHLKNGGILPQFLLITSCIWPITAAIESSSSCSLLLSLCLFQQHNILLHLCLQLFFFFHCYFCYWKNHSLLSLIILNNIFFSFVTNLCCIFYSSLFCFHASYLAAVNS